MKTITSFLLFVLLARQAHANPDSLQQINNELQRITNEYKKYVIPVLEQRPTGMTEAQGLDAITNGTAQTVIVSRKVKLDEFALFPSLASISTLEERVDFYFQDDNWQKKPVIITIRTDPFIKEALSNGFIFCLIAYLFAFLLLPLIKHYYVKKEIKGIKQKDAKQNKFTEEFKEAMGKGQDPPFFFQLLIFMTGIIVISVIFKDNQSFSAIASATLWAIELLLVWILSRWLSKKLRIHLLQRLQQKFSLGSLEKA